MKVLVPKSVDVNELLSQIDLSRTRKKNIKNKIYYFLSKIVLTNHNYKLYEKYDWYRQVCSKNMNLIFRRDYKIIYDILTNNEKPIIQSNKSYSSSNFCLGYRLISKYNTGEVIYKTLPSKFDKLLIDETPQGYEFILNQFHRHQLSIDDHVYNYIKSSLDLMLDKVENENEKILVYNKIGRWLDILHKIENNDIWKNISHKNKRLNSSITGLDKFLRSFLLCNDNQLVTIDIKASQPYILASILNNNFFNNIDNNSFNFNTIYNEIYYLINYSNNDNIDDLSSFMFARFLNENEDDIVDYQSSPFEDDFYSYIYSSIHHLAPTKEQRNLIKKNMMFFLFDDNLGHRNNNESIKIIASRFPVVDTIIKLFLKRIGKKRFAYLLQRTESYLMLNCVCKEFLTKFPEAPLFTIHDACMTTPEYADELYQIMRNNLLDITGIVPGLTIKYPSLELNPNEDDIMEWYDKIHKNGKPYRFKKMKRSVFSSNINRATEFQKE